MDNKLRSFDVERVRVKMKEDFESINTLEDLKDFLLQVLPKMMETDVNISSYVVETLEALRMIMKEVNEKEQKWWI